MCYEEGERTQSEVTYRLETGRQPESTSECTSTQAISHVMPKIVATRHI